MTAAIKAAIDGCTSPASVFVGTLAMLTALYLGRRWFVRPAVAAVIVVLSAVFFGVSLCDENFAAIVLAPDNIPIVAMLYLLAFFTWLATSQAVKNDRLASRGDAPVERPRDRKFFTWPDLVYSELICMVGVTTLLIAWSLLVRAPLEEPANPAMTPNPSKAPWYFLGLQEMLFYSDSWVAGVAVPCVMVLGLMAIPYLDLNPEGSGYYTIDRRRFAYLVFQFGFLQLWVLLIVVGTFFRGPNWGFFGLYEVRDPQWLPAMENAPMPTALGPSIVAAYFLGLPLLGMIVFRSFRRRLGLVRFTILLALLLLMLAVPLRMLWEWTRTLFP